MMGFCLVLVFSFEKQRLIRCNCGDKSFYSDSGSPFLISSTVSISQMESSSWTPLVIRFIHICNIRLRVYIFFLVSFDSLAGKAFSARSIKLCLVDNQQSSGVAVAGFESCWFEAGLSTSSSPPIERTFASRKIGPRSHQVVSGFQVVREVLSCFSPH